MGDKMRLIPFGQLMNWVLTEKEQKGSIFGVNHFYKANPSKTLPIFKEKIETSWTSCWTSNTVSTKYYRFLCSGC